MKKILKKAYPVVIGVVISCIITSLVTFILTTVHYSDSIAKLKIVESFIEDKYYKDYDKDNAMENAVKGYVSSLGDPYTQYFTASEYEKFYSEVTGEFCGIGVMLTNDTENNAILIIDVFEKSPAEKAGLQEGDIITKVEGVSYDGEQLNEATDKMKGEEGTEVNITVLKKDKGNEIDLKIIRQNIVAETVDSEVIDENIGYIHISQFGTNTASEFVTHLDTLMSKNIKGLIVDVRDNPGGSTETLEAIASCVLPKGAVIYYTADKNDNKQYFKSEMDGEDVPLVVLANENSASASEIFVGAVKDNKRGVVVGTKTFGKGLVQEIVPLRDGSAIKITIEKYYTPNGNYIHGKGIEPDYVVELEGESDTQLEKALEILKNQ